MAVLVHPFVTVAIFEGKETKKKKKTMPVPSL
jgi:hypothetical protein